LVANERRPHRRTSWRCLLPLVWACLAPAAYAQGPLHVEASACPGLDVPALERMLATELTTLGSSEALDVRIGCDVQRVHVALQPGQEPASELELALNSGEKMSRERLLSLRISEWVATRVRAAEAAQAEKKLELPPPPARPAPPPPPPPPQPVAPRALRELGLSAHVKGAGSPFSALGGLSLSFVQPLALRFVLYTDLRGDAGRVRARLATVRWLDGNAALAILYAPWFARVGFAFGPGLRAGWSRLAATPAQRNATGKTLGAPWASATFTMRLTVPVSQRWSAGSMVEAGWVFVPVRGVLQPGGATLVTLERVFVSFGLAVIRAF
jgi:hypothetical protein